MSWRIEQANPFAVLRELPDGLFQTCLLRLPADRAILAELFRVTRDDGTLWLLGASHCTVAQEAGWRRPSNTSVHPRLRGYGGGRCPTVTLLAKRSEFYFNPRLLALGYGRHGFAVGRQHPGLRSPDQRRAWCVHSNTAAAAPRSLIEWCIRASTSPRACQICGAPWRHHVGASGVGRTWRPGCTHRNGRGKCLVLDPFCGTGQTGVIAVLAGCSYLGIESQSCLASVAAQRLAGVHWGTVR
jgi:hypothetical protein